MNFNLRCHLCQTAFPATALWVCDKCLGPLEVTYDYATIAKGLSRARIESRHGATETRVVLDAGLVPGTAFLSFHFPETHANRVVGPAHDPESHCPEYKLTAVRVARV